MQSINEKKSVKKGVKAMTKKVMSWSQVCKQLSGVGGYVEVADGKKVRPIELMRSLGVITEKNSYKVKDILAAWNVRMKDGEQVLMCHAVPYMIDFMGFSYRLNVESSKFYDEYVGVSVKQLCPLVSATDKGDNTVTVSAANVLRGLQQSLYVDDTLDAIKKSEEKCAAMKEGYINLTRDKNLPAQWVRVAKDGDGVWSIVPEQVTVAMAAQNVAKESFQEKEASVKTA